MSSDCSLKNTDDDELIGELNSLKTLYDEKTGKGFNPNDGYFYTGIKDTDGSPEIIYRDESDNLSVHFINDRFKRHAVNVYKKEGIPFNVDDFFTEDVTTGGGTPSQEMLDKDKASIHTTYEQWYELSVEKLKQVLKNNVLKVSGNKQ